MIKGSLSSRMPCTCRLFVCLCCRHFHGPRKWRRTKASQEMTRARHPGWKRPFNKQWRPERKKIRAVIGNWDDVSIFFSMRRFSQPSTDPSLLGPLASTIVVDKISWSACVHSPRCWLAVKLSGIQSEEKIGEYHVSPTSRKSGDSPLSASVAFPCRLDLIFICMHFSRVARYSLGRVSAFFELFRHLFILSPICLCILNRYLSSAWKRSVFRPNRSMGPTLHFVNTCNKVTRNTITNERKDGETPIKSRQDTYHTKQVSCNSWIVQINRKKPKFAGRCNRDSRCKLYAYYRSGRDLPDILLLSWLWEWAALSSFSFSKLLKGPLSRFRHSWIGQLQYFKVWDIACQADKW